MIYKAGEGLRHSGNTEIDELTVAFFDYLLCSCPTTAKNPLAERGLP